MSNISIGWDLDCVVLDTIPAILELHHILTGEIPKIHHSESKSWDFKDAIAADRDTINSYFEKKLFFDLVNFMTDKNYCMRDIIEELISSGIDNRFFTKGTERNVNLKKDYLTKNICGVTKDMITGIGFEVEGKPDVNTTIFVDDVAANLNGKAKYNILFRKNGLITEYNDNVPDNVYKVCNSVTEFVNAVCDIILFEESVKSL
jgi:hypothetical protein